VLQNRGHARLLQHDLGNPYPVGIAVLAPGKLARVLVVPPEQNAREAIGFRGGDELWFGDCFQAGSLSFIPSMRRCLMSIEVLLLGLQFCAFV
jgi:hypothetical protein